MPHLELTLTSEQLHRLPRHPAYRYEHSFGTAWLTPRPRFYHALLDLRPLADAPRDQRVRRMRPNDWAPLVPVFAEAFRAQQPFGGLEDGPRHEAAEKALEQTRSGGDGPLIEQACFVLTSGGALLGAILPTLLPAGDPTEPDSYYWLDPPPRDCVERRLGRPHLTWVFVVPAEVGGGLGTALLHATARALLALGFEELASTFLLGNDSSMLWHWRCGFQLLPYPLSRRRARG
jgi:hypothetical protein